MAQRSQTFESISNLSMDLVEHALRLLQTDALPVYRKSIDRRDPPFAHGEFTPSAICVLLLHSGVDYHLSRLKYLRDIAPHKPPLPHTPYFNWGIDDYLSGKIDRLLIQRNERRLKEQLLELTVIRDSIAHPRLYTVKEIIGPDLSITKSSAKLASGIVLRKKALDRKRTKTEHTKTLRLPLVPTWMNYRDIVMCILVVNRFLNLLQTKYGNYAWVGGFSALNRPDGFFTGWGQITRRRIELGQWARAFFNSLSPSDQDIVRKRLGGNTSPYLNKPTPRQRRLGKGAISDILRSFQKPPTYEFLRKPPPWAPRSSSATP